MTALFESIKAAHESIRPAVPVSPLARSAALSRAFGCEVLLKCEHLQPTGSFKIRGATNKIIRAGEQARRCGVTTASTGNHGQAVAHAAAAAGVEATVYVAATAAAAKVDAIRALGVRLVVIEGPPIAAELAARGDAQSQGKIYVSPYNDLDVIAGQGTLGLELLSQAPDIDAVFVAVGGGGLISGVGTVLKHLRPSTQVFGVWPEASPCMLRAMEAGRIVAVEERDTLSDGTAGAIEEDAVTLPICRQVIDSTVTVSESQIREAMRRIADTEHWIVEGAAAVALAGLAASAAELSGRRAAVVLCGRNIGLDTFLRAVSAAAERR